MVTIDAGVCGKSPADATTVGGLARGGNSGTCTRTYEAMNPAADVATAQVKADLVCVVCRVVFVCVVCVVCVCVCGGGVHLYDPPAPPSYHMPV